MLALGRGQRKLWWRLLFDTDVQIVLQTRVYPNAGDKYPGVRLREISSVAERERAQIVG